MTSHTRTRWAAVARAAILALALPAAPSVTAAVVTTSPTLPLLGVPYVASTGLGCLTAAGVCIDSGVFTQTSLVSSSFNPAGQNFVTNLLFTGTLTDLAHNPIGPVTLTGSAEQEVLGRTFSSELGVWAAELLALNLTGAVLGHTLTLGLATALASTGVTSIELLAGPPSTPTYRVDSFFDVFVELSLDSPVPLHIERGPVRMSATEVPEPASLALLGIALAGLGVVRRRAA